MRRSTVPHESAASSGEAPVVFDFWTGDDTDATITIDAEGMVYVAVELQRFLPRAGEVGQLVKLDPYTDGDPIVWSVEVPPRRAGDDGGIWATPALHGDVLYVSTHAGDLLGVESATGEVFYRERIGYHEWGSPAVVDDTLVGAAEVVVTRADAAALAAEAAGFGVDPACLRADAAAFGSPASMALSNCVTSDMARG